MAFDGATTNAGSGGLTFAVDTFTDTDAVVRTMPFGALAFGPLNGPYVPVTTSNGLPVAVVGSVPVTGTFWQATQPISAAALPLPLGAATENTLTSLSAKITACNTGAVVVSSMPVVTIADGGGSLTIDGTVSVSGTVAVTGPLTDVQLRASAVPVSGTVTAQDGGGSLTVDDGGVTLSIDDGGGSITVDGAVTVSGEVDVLPSSPSATDYLPVRLTSGSAFLAALPVTDNSGSLSVDDNGGSLTVDSAQLPSGLGQTNMAGSVSVVVASNQSTLPVGPIGAGSIATGQVTINTSATQIVAARTGRRSVTVVNHGTTAIYLGGSGVSASTGVLLAGVAGAAATIETAAAVHGITGSGSQPVSYIEEY